MPCPRQIVFRNKTGFADNVKVGVPAGRFRVPLDLTERGPALDGLRPDRVIPQGLEVAVETINGFCQVGILAPERERDEGDRFFFDQLHEAFPDAKGASSCARNAQPIMATIASNLVLVVVTAIRSLHRLPTPENHHVRPARGERGDAGMGLFGRF